MDNTETKSSVTSTTVAHMDPQAWDTGSANEHPVDQFWIGRFLESRAYNESGESHALTPALLERQFLTKGLEASWISYDGGLWQCSRRHFAKRQMLLNDAFKMSLSDCEIREEGMNVN